MYNTPFLNKSKSKNECYVRTSVLLLECIVNINNKYYPVVFSNECKYLVYKEKKKEISEIDKTLFLNDFHDSGHSDDTDD